MAIELTEVPEVETLTGATVIYVNQADTLKSITVADLFDSIITAGSDLAGTYPDYTIKESVELTGLVQIDAFFGVITEDTDGATITFDMEVSNKHTVILEGNRTLAVDNDVAGQTFLVILEQDDVGSRTVTWWSNIAWPGGTPPTLTTTANKRDVFSFLKIDATNYLGFVVGQNL